MPLIIKVAVSRKLTEDFNSRGWSLDIQSEFDPRTFDDTDALANSTNHLFQLATDLLEQQVQEASPAYQESNGNSRRITNNGGNHRLRGNGAVSHPTNGKGGSPRSNNGRNERLITSAQINALSRMAQKFDTNAESIAQQDFGCKLAELTIKQASDLIDRLKKGLEAREANGGGR